MKNIRHTYLSLAIGLAFSTSSLAATISGKITDTNGRPVKNAEVTIEGTNIQTFSAEDGSYYLNNVDPEHVHIHVYSTGHIHGDRDIGEIPEKLVADFVLIPTSVENIVVTANSLQTSVLESVTPVSVLSAEQLRKQQAPTLGETLKSTPGVHSNYFGPVASSPIIRGTDGPRVKIVQNGLDSSDASRIGPDHNVASDTSSAQQVEVLRGPATLQYGSGAIGGVVNIVDRRIPSYVPDALEGEVELRYETSGNERFGKVDITGGTGNVAFHFDAYDRKTDDYSIPGYALSAPHEEDESGTLEGSAIDTTNYTGGLSYVTDKGYVGFAIQTLDNFYGVPGHGHNAQDEHADEAGAGEENVDEAVNLQVDMDRYQLSGEWFAPIKGISTVKFRSAYTDYQHTELEGENVGTIFTNKTTEGRIAVHHDEFDGWHGVVGLHYSNTDFAAIGDEAYTPPSKTDSIALYVLEEKRFDKVTVQFGGRVESTDLSADPVTVDLLLYEAHDEADHQEEHNEEQANEVLTIPSLSFTNVSLSAGANWEYTPGYSIAVSLARSERAPSHQELFSAGNHLSTQTYDLGAMFVLGAEHVELNESGVQEEVSTNIDVTWRRYIGDWGFTVSAFYNQVNDYMYQANTGFYAAELVHDHGDEEVNDAVDEHEAETQGFPVYRFVQEDADIYGLEAQANYRINDVWKLDIYGDYIRAQVDSDNLPRIPPLRVGAELGFEVQDWYGDVEVVWYDDQTDVSEFETATDGYTLVNMSVNYQYQAADFDWTFFVRGTNLTDEEARVHTSFLKDRAPLPSRGVVMGVRASF